MWSPNKRHSISARSRQGLHMWQRQDSGISLLDGMRGAAGS